jgi:hypothetical protein
MDRDRPDVLGDDEDDVGEEHDEGPAHGRLVQAVLAPEALALASVVLATVSLLGVGLLNGMNYLAPSWGQAPPDGSDLLAPALLGAGLALLPAVLGALALRRLPDGSPSRGTAGAGVLLAAVAVVLRLVIAVRASSSDGFPFAQF